MILGRLNRDNNNGYRDINKTIIISIFFTVLLSCSKDDTINCVSFSFPDDYKYPVIPGTQEWIDLESRPARAQACIIPQEILESISTGGLLESLLNYPFIMDYGYWDKFQSGFNQLKSENIGFTELYQREDIYQVLYDRYKLMSLNCEDIYPPFIGGISTPVPISFTTIELFIFQDEFLGKLNQNKVIEVFKLTYEKLQLKIDHEYFEIEKLVSAAILGKIMHWEKFKPFMDECSNNEFIEFFIESIPNFSPAEINPAEIITKYAGDFYSEI